MKKVLVVLFILVSFFIGLSLGDNSYTKALEAVVKAEENLRAKSLRLFV